MIFGILFILAFLIGLAAYLFSERWPLSIAIPCVLFFLNLLSDSQANWGLNLIFGLPIVLVGGLLGAYVVVIYRGEDADEADSITATEGEDSSNDSV